MIKGSKRNLNRINICRFCGIEFACADPKNERCQECHKCQYCGIRTRSQRRTCQKCKDAHPTQKQQDQWIRLHESIKGDRNPSKRPDIRKRISESKLGDLNPARKYREQYAERIAKYRPGKVSKLEGIVAQALKETPDGRYLQAQHPVRWYAIDFAHPKAKLAIEVQGCWYHSCQQCFPGSPTYKTQKTSYTNDLRKRKFLKKHKWQLIELWEHNLRNKTNTEIVHYFNFKKTAPLRGVIKKIKQKYGEYQTLAQMFIDLERELTNADLLFEPPKLQESNND